MDTEWHRITCFNGLGKTIAENCEKGMKVLVHGRIHYTKWTDNQGFDRYGCEIIAEKVDFLVPSRPSTTTRLSSRTKSRSKRARGWPGGSPSGQRLGAA